MTVKPSNFRLFLFRLTRYLIIFHVAFVLMNMLQQAPIEQYLTLSITAYLAFISTLLIVLKPKHYNRRFDLVLTNEYIAGPGYWTLCRTFIESHHLVHNSLPNDMPKGWMSYFLIESVSNKPIRIIPFLYDTEELNDFFQRLKKTDYTVNKGK